MARASFGGGGDYSSLFASVYGQASYADAAAKAEAATKKAEQAATDQDMANQWQNGVISNTEWLDYIQTRIDALKASTLPADITAHEKWVGYQRVYTQQIGDADAEYKFSNGGSISELISYYQGKVTDTPSWSCWLERWSSRSFSRSWSFCVSLESALSVTLPW